MGQVLFTFSVIAVAPPLTIEVKDFEPDIIREFVVIKDCKRQYSVGVHRNRLVGILTAQVKGFALSRSGSFIISTQLNGIKSLGIKGCSFDCELIRLLNLLVETCMFDNQSIISFG